MPKKILNGLGKEDDYLYILIGGATKDRIVLELKVVAPKSQACFFAKEWQFDEREAEEGVLGKP